MTQAELRTEVVQVGLEPLARGGVHGTAGKMSVRAGRTSIFAISRDGMPFLSLSPADIVFVDVDGRIVDGVRTHC